MPSTATQELLSGALIALEEKQIPLNKIVIQKFVYFFDTAFGRSGFRFKPFSYGPFSFELAEALDNLEFKGHIECHDNQYILRSQEGSSVSPQLLDKLHQALELFSEVADNKFDFRSMEILGTALYCARSLKASGEGVTEEGIIDDFKAWKGSKYSDRDISIVSKRLLHRLSFA